MKTRHTDDFSQGDFWLPRREPAIPPAPILTKEYLAANRLGVGFPKRWRARVQKTESGCWLWQASRIDGQYGQIFRGAPFTGMVSAHVASWTLFRGPVPAGLCVLHQCDNPPCCNPSHLFLGTRADNNRDKASKGRSTKGQLGVSHKLSPESIMEVGDLTRHRIFPQEQIASEYGITKERVKQIKREAQTA
jgi:hypothetical protein